MFEFNRALPADEVKAHPFVIEFKDQKAQISDGGKGDGWFEVPLIDAKTDPKRIDLLLENAKHRVPFVYAWDNERLILKYNMMKGSARPTAVSKPSKDDECGWFLLEKVK